MQSFTRRNAVGMTSCATPPEKRLRMVVLGASGVGKTQLVSRFLDRPFTPTYLPTAEEFHRTKYIINGRTYQLDILDTAGHILSPVMQNLTILTGDLFLVVYSVTDRGSWEKAKDLVASIEEITSDPRRTNKCIERSFKDLLYPNGATTYEGGNFSNGINQKTKSPKKPTPIPILLVGNKFDADNHKVQPHEVQEWFRQRSTTASSKVDHISASAKNDFNVQSLYDRLFSMSSLPCELSPNMHRKVSEGVYSQNSPRAGDKASLRWDTRPKSADFARERKTSRRSLSKKTSYLRATPGCQSSGSSMSESSSEGEEIERPEQSHLSTNAIATICENQRRPSVDTEVLLAFTKVRAYSPETKRKKKELKSSTFGKLKKGMVKLKITNHS